MRTPPKFNTSLTTKPPLAKRQSHSNLTKTSSSWWHSLHPHTKGKAAETFAHLYFRLQGFKPLPQPRHTIAQTDLLLQKKHLILMVEVKARTTRTKAHLALHPAQLKRLHAQARKLAAQNPSATVRLDALFLFPHFPFLHHVQHIPLA